MAERRHFGVDFRSGRAMRDGTHKPLGQAISFTRPSPRYARTGSGAWRLFEPDEPAITDLGLSIEAASTNLVINNIGDAETGIALTGTTMTALPAAESPARDGFAKRVVQGDGATAGVNCHSLATIGGQLYSWSHSFRYDGSATWVRFTYSDNVGHGINIWVNLQSTTLGLAAVFGTATLHSCTLVPLTLTGDA